MPLFDTARDLYSRSIKKQISPDDLDTIIAWPHEELSLLFGAADQVRRHFFGNTVEPCGIMNVKSGACSEDCAFCAQSGHHSTHVNVTALSDTASIVAQYTKARAAGLDFCLVSSGRRLSPDEVISVAASVRACNGPVHASLGILEESELKLLKDAGVVCYNHNLEVGKNYFDKIVTTHTYDDRVSTVKSARNAGLSTCSGGIFGVGESWSDRKELCLHIQQLEIACIPINFLNAIEGTRVAPPKETPLDFLKIVSLFRLACADKTIKVGGGREVNLAALQPLIFFAGANSYISGGYLTTGGDGVDRDDQMIKALGLVKKPL